MADLILSFRSLLLWFVLKFILIWFGLVWGYFLIAAWEEYKENKTFGLPDSGLEKETCNSPSCSAVWQGAGHGWKGVGRSFIFHKEIFELGPDVLKDD